MGRARHVHGATGFLTKDPAARDGLPPDHVPSISQRYRAPGLLLCGAIAAAIAFLGSFGCVCMKFVKEKYRHSLVLGTPYASQNGYWPETVSESVSDANSAAGKIFFTFCLISGITLLISWYPFSLRNVYTGPATLPCDLMYWATFRQYCIPMGIFTLIGVSVYPSQIAKETNGGMLCLSIHLMGAAMMFVGYMVSEFKCLEMFGMKLPKKVDEGYLDVLGKERTIRQICAFLMFIFYIIFIIFEALMMIQAPCCADEWLTQGTWYSRSPGNETNSTQVVRLTDSDISVRTGSLSEWHILSEATVKNTATGTYFWYKVGAYSGECLAGVFLILSHITIWYFCEERQVKYADATLDMVYDEEELAQFCFGDDEDYEDEDETLSS